MHGTMFYDKSSDTGKDFVFGSVCDEVGSLPKKLWLWSVQENFRHTIAKRNKTIPSTAPVPPPRQIADRPSDDCMRSTASDIVFVVLYRLYVINHKIPL